MQPIAILSRALTHFLSWWFGELRACVPRRLRSAMSRGAERLVISLGAELPDGMRAYLLPLQVAAPLGFLLFYYHRGHYPELRGYPFGRVVAGLEARTAYRFGAQGHQAAG